MKKRRKNPPTLAKSWPWLLLGGVALYVFSKRSPVVFGPPGQVICPDDAGGLYPIPAGPCPPIIWTQGIYS